MKKKKILSLLLSLCLVMTLVVIAIPASAEESLNGKVFEPGTSYEGACSIPMYQYEDAVGFTVNEKGFTVYLSDETEKAEFVRGIFVEGYKGLQVWNVENENTENQKLILGLKIEDEMWGKGDAGGPRDWFEIGEKFEPGYKYYFDCMVDGNKADSFKVNEDGYTLYYDDGSDSKTVTIPEEYVDKYQGLILKDFGDNDALVLLTLVDDETWGKGDADPVAETNGGGDADPVAETNGGGDSELEAGETVVSGPYAMTEMDGVSEDKKQTFTKGGAEDLVITIKGTGENDDSFEKFKDVYFDGEKLTKDKDYTVKKGSTIVTLSKEYLEKAKNGKHTITVEFENGRVDTAIDVKIANTDGPEISYDLAVAFAPVMLIAVATAVITVSKKSKKFEK